MAVRNFTAESNPRGGRIDLSWLAPTQSEFPNFRGVRIFRRESTHPAAGGAPILDDNTSPPGATASFIDSALKGNTVYYYSIFAYDNDGKLSAPVLASAYSTEPYESGDRLYDDLPGLYAQFDTSTPPAVSDLDPDDRTKGQLRRLIELFGLQFDLMRSFAAGTRDFADVDRVDGSLIPLLADWLGWQTDFTLPLVKQRNEVRYAPHFHRTTGIAANLRATLNRLTTWDAQVKEFVHNVFVTNAPEQLLLQETERTGTVWPEKPEIQLVTLDVAYRGRPAVLNTLDGRVLLFYHARQSLARQGSTLASEQWQVWFKSFDRTAWEPAQRVTFDGEMNRHPSVAQTPNGNIWVFWTRYPVKPTDGPPTNKLLLLSAGRSAHTPLLRGANVEPFPLADGNDFKISIDDGSTVIDRAVPFHPEDFVDITKATSAEVAALLNRELPGVDATVEEGSIVLTSATAGATSKLTLPASPVATALGLSGPATGADPTSAQLTGGTGPFALVDKDALVIRVDSLPANAVVFTAGSFTAAQVAAAINNVFPGLAKTDAGKLKLVSPTVGASSFLSIDVDGSTAASKLGFAASLPGAGAGLENTQPAVMTDNSGNIWAFWVSRPTLVRPSISTISYNRFDVAANAWGAVKTLTVGPDIEPAVAFDPGNGAPGQGRIWVAWSRKKTNDHWNIFHCTTTKIDFAGLADADWVQTELAPAPPDYDRVEPAPVFVSTNRVELYFSANRNDGWHVWFNTLSPAPAADEQQVTHGQFTCRAPAAIARSGGGVRLWFRNNSSQVYTSPSYPASQTIDARYAGATTADTRNAVKMGLRGNLVDVLRYTYDTGKREDDWYARDTVGIYLTPDTDNSQLILRTQSTLANVVRLFLPIQVRAVFVIQQVYPEFVYTYALKDAAQPRFIGEEVVDTILSETYTGIVDSFRDRVDFKFTRTWGPGLPKKGVIDLAVQPPDLSFRLFMREVEEGA